MIGRPPRSTLFPSTPLFRPRLGAEARQRRRDLVSAALPPQRKERCVGRALAQHDARRLPRAVEEPRDRKSTRLNSSHGYISYAVFCLKKKKEKQRCSCIRTA